MTSNDDPSALMLVAPLPAALEKARDICFWMSADIPTN